MTLHRCPIHALDGCSLQIISSNTHNSKLRKNSPLVSIREKCLDAGMDDYITKPVQKSKLEKAIENWADCDSPLTRASQSTVSRSSSHYSGKWTARVHGFRLLVRSLVAQSLSHLASLHFSSLWTQLLLTQQPQQGTPQRATLPPCAPRA